MLGLLLTAPEPSTKHDAPPPRPQKRRQQPRTFEFVSSDPAGKPAPEARKFIRSYVMRGKNTKRNNRLPGPLKPPPDMTLFSFANPLDDTSRTLIHRFFTDVKQSMYPVEWCFEFDPLSVCWFRWLLVDNAYLHSVLFLVSAFQDMMTTNSQGIRKSNVGEVDFSAQTHRFLRRTIQLLQARIQNQREQLLDSTAAVVATLAMVADAAGDMNAYHAHVDGLKKMVKMRGGLRGFQGNRQIQIKICCLDLGWSIKNGMKPTFFDDDISWKPFLATVIQNLGMEVDHSSSLEMQSLVGSWDSKLRGVFIDIRDFSRMANSLFRAHQKLQPQLFQEVLLSIQYRLLFLNYTASHDVLEEAVRLGLLAFESTLLLRIPGLKLNYMVFRDHMRSAIDNIDVTSQAVADIKLWLLVIGGIIIFEAYDPWVVASIKELTVGETWDGVRHRLKGIVWIDMAHDGPGCELFDAIPGV